MQAATLADSTEKSPSIRLVVVDDHPIFRAGLCEQFAGDEEGIEIVGEAENGEMAYAMVVARHPDVVLMDCHMPVMGGLEAIQKIKNDFPETKIIVFSATAEIERVRAVLRAGANGYLLKTASTAELRRAIHTVVGGATVLTPSIAFEPNAQDAAVPIENSLGLTKREIQILELAARGVTNKQIGEQLNLSSRTIEVHMHNIFMKLGVFSRTEAVTRAIRDRSIQLP
jgi:DNA-binding NarL/FixJ family response regulator